MCTSPILVSVEELQRAVAEITNKKVNPQEPASQSPTATSGQVPTIDTLGIADTIEKTLSAEGEKDAPTVQTGQNVAFDPIAQT